MIHRKSKNPRRVMPRVLNFLPELSLEPAAIQTRLRTGHTTVRSHRGYPVDRKNSHPTEYQPGTTAKQAKDIAPEQPIAA
jgi:hypothetical protein